MKNIKYIILSSVIVLATGLVSCLDSEFDVDESYNRLFSPVSFETTNETSTTVDFTWKNIPAASYYLIELSLTEDFAEVYKTYGENQEMLRMNMKKALRNWIYAAYAQWTERRIIGGK